MVFPPHLSSSTARGVGIAVFLILHLGLIVWFGGLPPAPGVGHYPDSEHLVREYDRYTGQHVAIGGNVLETDPVTIEIDPVGDSRLELVVEGIQQPIQPNQYVRIFGIANDDQSITAIRTVAIPPNAYRYTYAVSFLAGLWVLGRIISQWRVDPDSFGLTPKLGHRTTKPRAKQGDRDA